MGIIKPKRPTVVVAGNVQSVTPRTSSKSGTAVVFRHDVVVESADGGLLGYEVWERDGQATDLPDVARPVAVVVEIAESQQYGASLSFLRRVDPNDLDKLISAAGLGGK